MRTPRASGGDETARSRAKNLDAVAKAMAGLRPAREVLSLVRSVPTCLVQFDHAIRTGGWPIEVVSVGSGPSNHGKTAFALLLAKSFLDLGHFAMLLDAERTTPIDWVRTMVGAMADDDTYFKALRPDSYEDAVDATRTFVTTIRDLRADGRISSDTSGIVLVDSLRKLTPRGFFKAATKSDEADPMSGRGPMIKAKWNTAWMDELTPLLDATGTGFFAIAREYENPDADAWSRKMGTNVKLGGGTGIVFDSSLVIRIDRAGWVGEKKTEDGPGDVYGERHRIIVKKTKVGGKDGKVTTCYFHTSNGSLTPVGHDRARDVLDLAKRFGIVEGTSWLSWGKRRIGQGEHRSVVKLYEEPGLLAELEAEVRASFAKNEPANFDPITGEVFE